MTVANRRDINETCILVLDTRKFEEGPMAIIELPFRLRAGIHTSWVPTQDLPARKELCDMHGITPQMLQDYAETEVHTHFPSNAQTINRSMVVPIQSGTMSEVKDAKENGVHINSINRE